MPIFNFKPIRLLDLGCLYIFTYLMTNSVDPDQLASSEANLTDLDLHCLQRQGISRFSRTRVKNTVKLQWLKHFWDQENLFEI